MKKDLVMEIAINLKEIFGDNLISISLHGSMAQNDYHKGSDMDYFLVFKQINIETLKRLKQIKKTLEDQHDVELSLNIQKERELPKYRLGAFYHKNRYALFLHESQKIDKVLIGKNPFEVKALPSKEEVRLEAIRLINSFAYFLRKFIVNAEEDYAVKEAIRYVIISTQYANAFIGDFPLTTRESINNFSKNFMDFKYKSLPDKFFRYKRGKEEIKNKNELLNEAVMFLEELDEFIFSKFN